MTGVQIMQSIIEILVSGITEVAKGVGGGLSSLATSIFLDSSGEVQTLSVFGVLIVVFAGISLAVGLCRWVLNFVTSLGARNR